MERKLAAILSADVVGYSRLMERDEAGTLAALKEHRQTLIEPAVAEHGGRIVKLIGDGTLIEFASAVDAVNCSVTIQEAMSERTEDEADRRLQIRIGVNLGDVIVEGDDLYGDGVNVAARLEGLAGPGGICISGKVHDEIAGKVAAGFVDGGAQTLKNIARPVRIWHWSPGTEAPVTAGTELPLPDRPSLAVLPFINMSADPEQDYFADGIAEDIITEISRLPQLFVIARNSTFTYKGRATKVQEVARDLGVRYVLEGSVRKSGASVRITAQLIDGQSGGHVWAERYDRELADIFAVQDDVTANIVAALESQLAETGAVLPARSEPDNAEAYDCVLRGRDQYRLFSRAGNQAARTLYERAVTLDPSYAEAYAGLAETYLQDWFFGDAEGLKRAVELAETARGHDPSLPLVYEALSAVRLFMRQHDEALAAGRKWVEIEPGSAEAHANLAGLLHFSGEPERTAGLIARAKRLNPFYPFYYDLYVGQACFSMDRFADAVGPILRSTRQNPESLPSHFFLAACYGHLGEGERAADALADVKRLSPDFCLASARAIAVYRRAADLDRLIDGLRKAGLSE